VSFWNIYFASIGMLFTLVLVLWFIALQIGNKPKTFDFWDVFIGSFFFAFPVTMAVYFVLKVIRDIRG